MRSGAFEIKPGQLRMYATRVPDRRAHTDCPLLYMSTIIFYSRIRALRVHKAQQPLSPARLSSTKNVLETLFFSSEADAKRPFSSTFFSRHLSRIETTLRNLLGWPWRFHAPPLPRVTPALVYSLVPRAGVTPCFAVKFLLNGSQQATCAVASSGKGCRTHVGELLQCRSIGTSSTT